MSRLCKSQDLSSVATNFHSPIIYDSEREVQYENLHKAAARLFSGQDDVEVWRSEGPSEDAIPYHLSRDKYSSVRYIIL